VGLLSKLIPENSYLTYKKAEIEARTKFLAFFYFFSTIFKTLFETRTAPYFDAAFYGVYIVTTKKIVLLFLPQSLHIEIVKLRIIRDSLRGNSWIKMKLQL